MFCLIDGDVQVDIVVFSRGHATDKSATKAFGPSRDNHLHLENCIRTNLNYVLLFVLNIHCHYFPVGCQMNASRASRRVEPHYLGSNSDRPFQPMRLNSSGRHWLNIQKARCVIDVAKSWEIAQGSRWSTSSMWALNGVHSKLEV